MRRFLHPFLALILSLLLVSGQQAALAHMLGHAAGPAATGIATDVALGEDADHGAALSLSHVCTTCIAFAGIDVAPPVPPAPAAMVAGRMAGTEIAVPPAPTLQFSAAFRSRAPPSL